MADAPDSRPPVWIGHVMLRSTDAIAAAHFYERIGMRPIQLDEKFSVLEMRGGTHLALRHDPSTSHPARHRGTSWSTTSTRSTATGRHRGYR
jgi:catechol 2,3-dioxygenase-like lactoylglutathione lyase family enzyme